MSGIIKRKLRESWRDAVAARFASALPEAAMEGLSSFDAALVDGAGEAEAAYATLSAHDLLWPVDGAGLTLSTPVHGEADTRPSTRRV